MVAPDRSMDFLHIAAAGLLMQAVNVLRYNAVQFSLHFHGGKAAVCIVRFRFSGIQVLPIVGEERFRILLQALPAEVILRGASVLSGIFSAVKAVPAAEIRDSAFRGNAGTAQKDRVFR